MENDFMKVIDVKKGDLIGFHKEPACQDEYHVRGHKQDLIDFAKEENLKRIDIHPVTGTHAPVNEWYGIIY